MMRAMPVATARRLPRRPSHLAQRSCVLHLGLAVTILVAGSWGCSPAPCESALSKVECAALSDTRDPDSGLECRFFSTYRCAENLQLRQTGTACVEMQAGAHGCGDQDCGNDRNTVAFARGSDDDLEFIVEDRCGPAPTTSWLACGSDDCICACEVERGE